jgi:hypothetical protein
MATPDLPFYQAASTVVPMLVIAITIAARPFVVTGRADEPAPRGIGGAAGMCVAGIVVAGAAICGEVASLLALGTGHGSPARTHLTVAALCTEMTALAALLFTALIRPMLDGSRAAGRGWERGGWPSAALVGAVFVVAVLVPL